MRMKMNHRITLQVFSSVEDELGQKIEEWTNLKTVWCAIKTVKGREYFAAATTQNENTYRFIIRYLPGILPNMRIVFEGRIFGIESVLNDNEENRTITIIAKERH